jgi:hypothetical protein
LSEEKRTARCERAGHGACHQAGQGRGQERPQADPRKVLDSGGSQGPGSPDENGQRSEMGESAQGVGGDDGRADRGQTAARKT